MKNFGEKLLDKVAEKAKENFLIEVENGLRLSLDELMRLNPIWKKSYVTKVKKEDQEVQKHVDGMHGRVVEELKNTKSELIHME